MDDVAEIFRGHPEVYARAFLHACAAQDAAVLQNVAHLFFVEVHSAMDDHLYAIVVANEGVSLAVDLDFFLGRLRNLQLLDDAELVGQAQASRSAGGLHGNFDVELAFLAGPTMQLGDQRIATGTQELLGAVGIDRDESFSPGKLLALAVHLEPVQKFESLKDDLTGLCGCNVHT